MIRDNGRLVAIGLVLSALSGCSLADGKESNKNATGNKDVVPPVQPATRQTTKGCDARFVITKPTAGAANCQLSAERLAAWSVVPRDGGEYPSGDTQTPGASALWRAAPHAEPFCVYERRSPKLPSQQELEGFQAQPLCGLVASMSSSTVVADSYAPYVKLFDHLARGFKESAAGASTAPLTAKSARPPRVAVVDATPFRLNRPDFSGHGFAVSNVIANLACADINSPACSNMIVPYLALPWVATLPAGPWHREPTGGQLGRFPDLFRAIERALAELERDRQATPGQNLIINLSLGWDPIKTDLGSWEVEQMRTLLERAYCDGVLVIAAAGNVTGSEGAMVPAAFESFEPPTVKRCKVLGLASPPTAKVTSRAYPHRYAPLVHAVGGVDSRDERLVISRPWGHPRLAAYADAVTVPTPARTEPRFTTPLTGTSMSAAVVSGIAAAIWTAKPALSAPDVMAYVYRSGRVLDGRTQNKRSRCEFCLERKDERCDAWAVHRASLCTALNDAVPTAHLPCVDPSSAALLPPLPLKLAGPLAQPCRLTGCGEVAGPMGEQIPMGVLPQPPYPTCPGCRLRLPNPPNAAGLGAVHGTADYPTAFPNVMVKTILRTTQWNWTTQDFDIAIPPANAPYEQPVTVPANTAGAVIVWYYKPDGIVTITSESALLFD